MKTTLFTLLTFSSLFFVSCKETAPKEETPVEITEDTTAQVEVLEPAKFTYSAEKIADNQYKITFNCSIEDGWYVYSAYNVGDGPVPTSINFDDNESLGTIEPLEENGEVVKDGYDEIFELNVKKFGKSATFSKIVNVKNATTLTGYLEYQTCDDKQCIFESVEFTFDAK